MAWREVDGQRLQWARKQRDLTMSEVERLAGISKAFQSEVENRKKVQVTPHKLCPWVQVLGVNVRFAYGDIRRIREDPKGTRGLALDVLHLIEGHLRELLRPGARPDRVMAEILRIVAERSEQVPKIVLAYVMDCDRQTLDEMIAGTRVMNKADIESLAHLLDLTQEFPRFWEEPSATVMDKPSDTREYPPAPPLADESGEESRDEE